MMHHAYTVRAKKGCIVRSGVELDSAKVGHLPQGTTVHGAAHATLSKACKFRLEIAAPLVGWTTFDLLDRVDAAPTEAKASSDAAATLDAAPPPPPAPPVAAPRPNVAARVLEVVRWHLLDRWRLAAELPHVERLAAAPTCADRFPPWPLSNVLVAALDDVSADDGLLLEFGVFSGETVSHVARRFPGAEVFGFDSFEGLPEDWAAGGASRETFDVSGRLPPVPDNVTLVKGWFEDTLPPFLEKHPGPVRLVHVDSDLYSSAIFVLERLAPRLRPGSIVVFDELMNYGGEWVDGGEWKALRDFERRHPAFRYEWLCKGAAPTLPPRKADAHTAEQAALRVITPPR